jgi:hypothetical protein
MSPSRGGNRRVASLVDALRPHLPQPGVLRVPAAARAAHLAARRGALSSERPIVVVTRTDESRTSSPTISARGSAGGES